MMKRLVLASLLCLAAVSEGFGADLPVGPLPAAVAYTPPPTYNWSGFYVGLYGGYGLGTTSWNGAGFTTGNFNANGGVVGGTIGINYQANSFVFGFEADGGWAGLTGKSTNSLCGLFNAMCQTEQNWLATFRGRFGFAVNRILVFGTAGGATGDIQAGLNPPGTFDTSNVFGWAAGGGIEAALTENWTAKVDYLYVSLGNGACTTNNCGGIPITVPLTESLVRVGVNYKLPF